MSAPKEEPLTFTYLCPACNAEKTATIGPEKVKAIEDYYRSTKTAPSGAKTPLFKDKHPVSLTMYGQPLEAYHLVTFSISEDLKPSMMYGKECVSVDGQSCKE